jgi:hypothetical protein
MNLGEVISQLRERGVENVTPYRIHQAVAAGRVPRPAMSGGRFVYGKRDVEAITVWLTKVRRGRPRKHAKPAGCAS